MRIEEFGVERWMNDHEDDAVYNLGETCVASFSVDELLELAGEKEAFYQELGSTKLTYGAIFGSEALRRQIAALYANVHPDDITTAHGAIGANNLVHEALLERGDHVISFLPAYQQHYSIPESIGCEVERIWLRWEDGFLPNLDELRSKIRPNTKAICLTNPGNPTGAIILEDLMVKIVAIARENGAYIISDEAYRGLHHARGFTPSFVDYYPKAIATGSLSKTFSLAGLRIGWVCSPPELTKRIRERRDYNTISCPIIDEKLATIALKNKDKILKRNLSIIRTNAQILDQWIENSPCVDYIKPEAGTTAFVHYKFDIPSESFCQELQAETGAFLVPGSVMGMEHFLRIGYANHTDILRTGLQKITEYMEKLAKEEK